jgi:hypothetical protein
MTFSAKQTLGKIAAGTALAAVFAIALTGQAKADDRDWNRHEVYARHWHRAHPHPVPVITPVYAPPVVYAPPPPSPGINLILPLNFR